MRFGLVHRFMTNALAALGIAALVVSGKLNPLASALTVFGAIASMALPERFKQEALLTAAGVTLPLVILGVQVARFSLGAEAVPLVIEFAALLQVARLVTRRGAAHDHQVILLALLHLVAGTVLGGGLSYALSLIGFLVLTPGALVLSHLRREVEGNYRQGARDRTGMPVDVPRILRSRRVIGRGFLLFTCLLSVPVFLFTALLFVTFPRVGLSWLSVPPIEPRRVVGFSSRVDLGGVGTIRSDPTLVMRVRPSDVPPEPPLRRNLYLRGAVFDSYDGRAWSRPRRQPTQLMQSGGDLILRRPSRPTDRTLAIELDAIEPTVVFLPGEAVALRVTEKASRIGTRKPYVGYGTHGELLYETLDQSGLSYQAILPPEGHVLPETSTEAELRRYLTVPSGLSGRIVDLAAEMSGSETDPERIARRIEMRLRRDYKYDLSSPSGAAADPLADFLFVSKRGHCEFYSTAMAVLLRLRGIPSRNVTGFVGGTYNRFGEFYAVRQGDAHSWVEAYLPRFGWTRFDPTPPSSAVPQSSTEGLLPLLRELTEAAARGWARNVEGFNLEKQVGIVQAVQRAFNQVLEVTGAEGTRSGKGFGGRRLWLLASGLGLLAVGLVLLLRSRKTGPSGPARLARAEERSADLYRRLEAALLSRGVPRPVGTPPLTHAEALVGAGHPVGPEALALTEIYLALRYGDAELSAEDERQFRQRVTELRRPPEKVVPSAA